MNGIPNKPYLDISALVRIYALVITRPAPQLRNSPHLVCKPFVRNEEDAPLDEKAVSLFHGRRCILGRYRAGTSGPHICGLGKREHSRGMERHDSRQPGASSAG